MRKITKRSAAIAAAAVIGVGGLGVAAFANGWLVTGTGFTQAQASEVKPMFADAYLAENIYPGAVGSATVYIDNANDFPVAIDAVDYKKDSGGKLVVTATTGTGSTASSVPACVTAIRALNEALFVPQLPSTPVAVAGKSNDTQRSIPITVSSKLPQSCAGATLKVDIVFSGTSTTTAAVTASAGQQPAPVAAPN